MALSSLGGLSSLGTNGKLGLTPSQDGESGVHLSVTRNVSFSYLVNKEEVSWQGPWEDLVNLQKQLGVGSFAASISSLPEGGSDTEGGNFGYPRLSSFRLSRGQGGVGTLNAVITQNVHACSWSVDWAEVSKPIRTWHADKVEGAPDLDKLRSWEELDHASKAYNEFKVGGRELEGDTLELAKFIYKGIEHYTLYAPVITCSFCCGTIPQMGLKPIGEIGNPEHPYNWEDPHGMKVSDIINNITNPSTQLPYEWMLVSSKSSQNSDGTYQWNLAWQGADEIEESLYS